MARLVTFRHEGVERAGRLEGDSVVELAGSLPVPGDPAGRVFALGEVRLLAPVPSPPSVRDFYAFEAHVSNARRRRGLDMAPEWYEVPSLLLLQPRRNDRAGRPGADSSTDRRARL